MTDQFFITLFSNSSDNYFPENRPFRYTSILPETITLNGRWFIGLTELEYSKKSTSEGTALHLAVFADIVKASITANEKCSLLRYIPMVRSKAARRVFHTPASINYMEVNKQVIDRISIVIKPYGTDPESLFGAQPSRLTVHMTKAPPLLL